MWLLRPACDGVPAGALSLGRSGSGASAHWLKVDHPAVPSFEPGEDWGWCYADEVFLMPVF